MMSVPTDQIKREIFRSHNSVTPLVQSAPKYTVFFDKFYMEVYLRFFKECPGAKQIENLLATRTYAASQQCNMSYEIRHRDKIFELIDKEIKEIISSLSTFAISQVAFKAHEIGSRANTELIKLGYNPSPWEYDSITTDRKITDRDLFTVNKILEMQYGLILIRKD